MTITDYAAAPPDAPLPRVKAEATHPDAIAALARYRALLARKVALVAELERSLALKAFCPTAFDGTGQVQSMATGNIHTGYVFRVVTASGYEFEWPLREVPRLLWPDSLLPELAVLSQRQLDNVLRRGPHKEGTR